jgi:hypothetical protein
MPNALILGYQKSRIRHTPSHLLKWSRATRSFVKEFVLNTGSALPHQIKCVGVPVARCQGYVPCRARGTPTHADINPAHSKNLKPLTLSNKRTEQSRAGQSKPKKKPQVLQLRARNPPSIGGWRRQQCVHICCTIKPVYPAYAALRHNLQKFVPPRRAYWAKANFPHTLHSSLHPSSFPFIFNPNKAHNTWNAQSTGQAAPER